MKVILLNGASYEVITGGEKINAGKTDSAVFYSEYGDNIPIVNNKWKYTGDMEKDGIICTFSRNVSLSSPALSGKEAVEYIYSQCQNKAIQFQLSTSSYNSTHIILEFPRPVLAINWNMYFNSSINHWGYVYYYYKGKMTVLASDPHSTYVNFNGLVFDKVEVMASGSNDRLKLFNKGFELSYQIENL